MAVLWHTMRLHLLAFVFGVWLLQQQPSLPSLAWGGALLPLLWLAWRSRPDGLRVLLLASVFLGAGFLWADGFARLRLADALPPEWEGRDIRLVGVVAALPGAGERGQRFELDVERVLTPEATVPRHIQLTWYAGGFTAKTPVEPPPAVHAGERWQLTVRLKRPHGNVNPHGFDFEVWALERNLRALGYVRRDEGNLRLAERVFRPGYLIEVVREAVAQRVDRVLADQPYAGVLKALAVGEQHAITPAQWQVFQRTGVVHLMSISGLHVTMLSGLIFALVHGLWRRSHRAPLWLPARKAATLAGAAVALAYTWLSGFGVPTQRTLYMLAVVALALWLGRIAAISRVLALALAVVALLDPWAVLTPGFWLSFGAVGVMLYVSVGRMGRPHWLRDWAVTQWAVTLGLAPALLLLFQQVSLVSPLANAFAIPLVSLLVTPLALAGALLPLDFLLFAAHAVMAGCMAALEVLGSLPDAVWQQHAPPLWAVLAALAGVVWLLLPRGFPARWLGLAGLAPMFVVLPPWPTAGALWLTVLDVGQGLSVVVQTQHHALLYDTGPRFTAEADSGNRIIVPFLRASGIRHLDGLVVTHDDADHSGGALSVLQAVPVDWLLSSLPTAHPVRMAARRDILCHAGQSWEWDGVRFELLHPSWESHANPALKDNARGCVLKIESRFGRVLLPADIEKSSEQELLERVPDRLRAEVLVVPHHGSKTSSSEAFVQHVHPAIAVFTVGYRNRFGHPKAAVVERYQSEGTQLRRSDLDGALQLRFDDASGARVRAWRATDLRYWREASR